MNLSDRMARAFRTLIREMLAPDQSDETPAWAYFVPWEFQVHSATETSFSGRPTASRCPLADPQGGLVNIPLMPGIAGTGIKPATGSLVLVEFINGDPRRPCVRSWDQTVPESVALAMGTKGVVRVDDLGSAGTITTDPPGPAGTAIKITDAAGNVCMIPIALVGGAVVVGPAAPPSFSWATKATNGSTIVKAG